MESHRTTENCCFQVLAQWPFGSLTAFNSSQSQSSPATQPTSTTASWLCCSRSTLQAWKQ